MLDADYYAGNNVAGTVFESYEYGFDVAGNLTNMDGVTRTYNAANQMTNDGTNSLTYDNNGNLTSHGTQASIWDGANRLKSMGGHSYAYDGLNNRISQTANSVVTEYLLDVQPGLTKVIGATTSGNTDRYVHAQRGVHAMEDSSGVWTHPAQDGLGSVRMGLSDNLTVNGMQILSPFGVVESSKGAIGIPFGFTGEMADGNGLSYLRARYYNPETGTFTALDPFEGLHDRPMSLNGYSWVEGNPINRTDSSGLCWLNNSASPDQQSQCNNTWESYLDIINEQYPTYWPTDVVNLVNTEGYYWGNLSYPEFVEQWNSSRPSASMEYDLSAEVLTAVGSQAPRAAAAAAGDATLPIGEIIGLGILCWAAYEVLTGPGTIALPLRQPIDFSTPRDRSDDIEIPWPIPPTLDGPKVVLYRAIDSIELTYVRSVGFTNYGFSPNANGKYFALTLAGVTSFAGADMNSHDIFTITKIRVSPPIILLGYIFNDVGQQGAGWSIQFSDEALVALYADLLVSNERIVIIGAR